MNSDTRHDRDYTIQVMKSLITAAALWDGSQLIASPRILVEDGQILSLNSTADAPVIDLGETTLAPAFLDVHTHGAAGHDIMEATPEALIAMSSLIATRGVGGFLATTVTAPVDDTLRSLEGIARLIEQPTPAGQARMLGIHLEGPFLSHSKRGVHPPADLKEPSIELFDRFFEAANGHVTLMTLAPELPGAIELARHAIAKGVRISMGHSTATKAETVAGIEAGATNCTHTFNAMRPLDHREPGILGTALADPRLFAEIICDGIHTHPDMVRIWWRAKGADRALLVTDAMSAAGMPDGQYKLGGIDVEVANNRAMANGVLAGSVLTLDLALANLIEFTNAPLTDALKALTRNPAQLVGLTDKAGSLSASSPANLVALDARGHLQASIIGGQRVK